MKTFKPTIKIFLMTWEQKEDETFPVKIKVTFKRKRRYFAIQKSKIHPLLKVKNISEFEYNGIGDYAITQGIFLKATGTKPRGKFALLHEVFTQIETDARNITEKMKVFDFNNFSDLFNDVEPQTTNDVFKTFANHIKMLELAGRIRTAASYGCTLASLKKFHKNNILPFEKLTVKFVSDFAQWMKITRGNNDTTVGIYLRQLRAIFNQRPESLMQLPSPFGQRGFQIPKTKGRKIALQMDELKKLFEYIPEPGTAEEKYLNLWKFQYLCAGINVTDLALLKYENLQNGFIVFHRHKTERTRTVIEPIRIAVNEKISQILEKYKQHPKNDKTFIFPFLNDKMTPLERDRKISQLSKNITKTIKSVALKIEIDPFIAKRLTSYSSRHTFATTLMKQGAPVALISRQLGHTSLETTTSYLEGFEDKHLQEWQNKLTDFS